MPRIFDNIEQQLLPALREALQLSKHSDFCVGYFNLRGWKAIDALIENWHGGDGNQCRLLVGMQKPPHEQLRRFYSLLPQDDTISNQVVIRLKKKLAGELNVDVLNHDATQKLAKWFEDRWNDRYCVDITNELIKKVIEESWAREEALYPYWIYIKMAHHLAEEARAGLSEFEIPRDMRNILLEFQSAAVRIAGRVDEFTRRHQCPVNSLPAFEKSGDSDDWRELMRLFMVRRT